MKLTWLYVLCALLFAAGFIFRAIGAFDYNNVTVYIVSICLCYAAPPLYKLGNYYVPGRILSFVPYHSPPHPGHVLTTFAAISPVIGAPNGIGASYAAVLKDGGRRSSRRRGSRSSRSSALVAPMLANSVLLDACYQRRWLPVAAAHVYLARDGVTEVPGPRCVLASLLYPFDLYGMVKGRRTTRFGDGDEDGAGVAKERLVGEPPVASMGAHEGV
ncbi:hypothetical protein F4775DRAFT_599844 [Biscogniauxia sp. FL1348]|nr:hypothetical protein F4775DRAFT_599844 [Biscogniauxia sp. FL1348]